MVLEREYPEDERVTKEIETLQANGHKVILACFTEKNRKRRERIGEIEIVRKPISVFIKKTSVGALKAPFYFSFWSDFIKDILKSDNIDALHIHDLPLAKVGYKLGLKYNKKFVLDLHENWPVLLELSPHTHTFLGKILSSTRQWLKYEKKYASLANGLIVVADEMRNRLLSKGISNKNIAVVPNTSPTKTFTDFKNVSPDTNFITLYYAGGINEHRGLNIVLEGLSKITLPDNFRFWIIGKGKNEPFLKNMVKELNLEKYVIFCGWKTHSEVLEMLFKSDIAVIPHLKNEHTDNTSPNKIFHYMLAAKPILSSDCVYLKNLIIETNAGLIYPDTNSNEFGQKLIQLINDNKLRIELGKNGLKAAKEKYNWANTSLPLIELYKNLN